MLRRYESVEEEQLESSYAIEVEECDATASQYTNELVSLDTFEFEDSDTIEFEGLDTTEAEESDES